MVEATLSNIYGVLKAIANGTNGVGLPIIDQAFDAPTQYALATDTTATGKTLTTLGANIPAGLKRIVLKNLDANITLYYGFASISSTTGWPLPPGFSVALPLSATGAALIKIIAASGTPNLGVVLLA
jgi:hypothetical protein